VRGIVENPNFCLELRLLAALRLVLDEACDWRRHLPFVVADATIDDRRFGRLYGLNRWKRY
jgi:hypothetical protein